VSERDGAKPTLLQNALLFLAAGIVSLTLGIAATEAWYFVSLRKSERWHDVNTHFDARLGWRPIPSRHVDEWGGITSNARGFRSPESVPGTPVIAIAGDSVAFGYGVRDDQTVSHHLAAIVRDRNLQVQNLAVSGYGLDQTYTWLGEHIGALGEVRWVVLVIFTGNDLGETVANESWGKSKPLFALENGRLVETQAPISRYSLRNLMSRSELIAGLRRSWPAFRDWSDDLAGREAYTGSEALRLTGAVLQAIDRLTREHGARLALALVPFKGDFQVENAPLRWFRQAARQLGRPTVDFHALVSAEGLDVDALYSDVTHLTNAGNQLLADAIATELGLRSPAEPPGSS